MAFTGPLLTIHAATIGRIALLIGLLSVTAATRQAVPVTTLSKPLAEFPEGYSNLSGIRELPDGRVLTIEFCERVVKLLDFGSGTAAQVGRTGAGPGEYRTPSRLFPLPGDSTAVDDGGNLRFLVIHPDGKPGRFFAAPSVVTQTAGSGRATMRFGPTTTDALGRFYARESSVRVGTSGLARADSVAIERWDAKSRKRDTLAFQKILDPGPVEPNRLILPFAAATVWAVALDGRLALLDPGDYHVDFIGPLGVRTSGKPIPFTRVRLTEGHRQQWRAERNSGCPRSMPAGLVTELPMQEEWPDYLPPFLSGAAVFAPDGTLWVRRTGEADDPPAYDLIDGTGRVVHKVVLAMRSKLLGFGKGRLYVVRVDEDDLQYLQRYRLPNAERP